MFVNYTVKYLNKHCYTKNFTKTCKTFLVGLLNNKPNQVGNVVKNTQLHCVQKCIQFFFVELIN